MSADHSPSPMLPRALKPGDTIGLVAPAGPLARGEDLNTPISMLEGMGYKVRLAPEALRKTGYLAGSDEQRARLFNTMWADPEIKALLAVRGGYGSLRMIDLLDMNLVRSQPKMLIGYSDISVILNAIFKETGLVNFLGPVATSLPRCDRESIASFSRILAGEYIVKHQPAALDILNGGQARGRLLGGNLTSLLHLLATPHELSWNNAILILEEVGESAYRIDRMLTHLSKAGRFKGLAGLILGSFTEAPFADAVDGEVIRRRVVELFKQDDIPIWGNFPTGHTSRNLTLPLGLEAEMDSSTGTLRLMDPSG